MENHMPQTVFGEWDRENVRIDLQQQQIVGSVKHIQKKRSHIQFRHLQEIAIELYWDFFL